jgi:hypothetical protein
MAVDPLVGHYGLAIASVKKAFGGKCSRQLVGTERENARRCYIIQLQSRARAMLIDSCPPNVAAV